MCLVAYLSVFGVTFGMASLALSILGPLSVALVVLALGFGDPAREGRALPRGRTDRSAMKYGADATSSDLSVTRALV